jgi:phospholipid/cholesterol/gamma-HCH transport system substrate-binding protein
LGRVSRPLLELLAAYAPGYPCLMRGLVALQPRVEETFAGGRFHITLEVTRDGGKYQPGRDEPVYGARNGPQCLGLPDPAVPAPEHRIDDGYDYGADRPAPTLPVGVPAAGPAGPAGSTPPGDMGTAGTARERELIRPIVGAVTGILPVEVPDIAVLLWGPLLRGAVVNLP